MENSQGIRTKDEAISCPSSTFPISFALKTSKISILTSLHLSPSHLDERIAIQVWKTQKYRRQCTLEMVCI